MNTITNIEAVVTLRKVQKALSELTIAVAGDAEMVNELNKIYLLSTEAERWRDEKDRDEADDRNDMAKMANNLLENISNLQHG